MKGYLNEPEKTAECKMSVLTTNVIVVVFRTSL